MLDKLKPYPLYFIQKASPGKGDAFDFAYIYKFYSERTPRYQRLKYIVHAESYEDVFAVKFYAARDRKLDNKYNRIIKAHGYTGAVRTFMSCASAITDLHAKFPSYSFVVSGAESNDLESDKVEGEENNQRFRIYRTLALQLFGRETFEHYQQEEVSTYMLVNRSQCKDTGEKVCQIKEIFQNRGFDF